MKRFLSALLSLTLLFSAMPCEVKAAENTSNMFVTYNEKGQYVLWNSSMRTLGNEKIQVESTEYEDVYSVGADELIIKTGDTTFQSVVETEILLDSYENVVEKLVELKVDEEVKVEILELTKQQNEMGNYSAKAVVFTAPETKTRATSTTTYTYSGHSMKDITTYYLNLQTDTKNITKGGSTAKGVAAALTQIGITAAGIKSLMVTFFSGGVSALTAYCNATGCSASNISTADPNNYNRVEAYVKYNTYTKRTYEDRGAGFELALISERYIINSVTLIEYFLINNTYGASKEFTKVFGTNSSGDIKSEHFANPAPFAIKWTGNCYDESIPSVSVMVGSKSIYLG